MASITPFFQAFGPLLFGRPAARQAASKLRRRASSLQDLYELFGYLFNEKLLDCTEEGANSRERVFSPKVTFWAFVAQVLSPESPCRETVRRVEAWWRSTTQAVSTRLSTSTSAYCQARARLDLQTLALISGQLAWNLERGVLESERPLGKRPVKLVDGTMLSMLGHARQPGALAAEPWPEAGPGLSSDEARGPLLAGQRRAAGKRHGQPARAL